MAKKVLKIIGAIVYTIRPSATLGACALVMAAFNPEAGEWATMTLLLLCTFFGSAFCFLMNDIYDRKKDLLNNKYRPIATGVLPVRAAISISVLFALLFLWMAYLLGLVIFLLAIVFVLLTGFYSFVNIKSGFLANLIVAFIVSGTHWGVAIIKPDPYLIPMAIFLLLFTIPREMVLDWMDEAGDKAFGKTSLAITYSITRFKLTLFLFLMGATATMIYLVLDLKPNPMITALFTVATLTAWGSFVRFFLETNRKNALFGVRFSHLTFALNIVRCFCDRDFAFSMRLISYFILSFFVFSSWGQLSTIEVLRKIESMQILEDGFYDAGLFPVERSWNASKHPVQDNSIFFTASIVNALNDLTPMMSLSSRQVVSGIRENAVRNYWKYQSRNNEPTFNFWQTTEPDLPFPNGNKLISNPKMRLPDDLDTSVLLVMTTKNDSLKRTLRKKMVAYAGRKERTESNLQTLKKYKESMAYEAWFAKDMPQTFDICVLTNTMSFVLSEKYELNTYDLASIDLIKRMIMENDHFERIDDISHHTSSSALVLYHVSGLIQQDHSGLFADLKPKVIDDLERLVETTDSEFEKMLISISLIRMGGYANSKPDFNKLAIELNDFSFFTVKPFIGNPQLAFLNKIVPDISWQCSAYNWTLFLEYLYLSKIHSSNLSGTR